MENLKTRESEELDPWSLFIYAMKAPMTRDRYQTRVAKFFDFAGISGTTLEEKARNFADRISNERRKIESDIMSKFFDLKPKLLGFIFDVLMKALQLKPEVKLNDLPRMADFALWGEAVARALGYKELEFINAYYDNIGRQNIEAIEAHPLGQAISKFFEQEAEREEEGEGEVLEGSPLEILEQLEIIAEQKKINTNHRLWPKSHNALTRRLNQIRSNLLEGLGIEVTITRVTKNVKCKVNTSSIKIRKIPPISPIPPVGQNHEGNLDNFAGDTLSAGGIISP